MLQFFRRLTKSKVGIVITFGVLIIIALAFAAGDITNIRGQSGGTLGGGEVAEVGDTKVTEVELRQRAQTAFNGYRQQQPTLDIATFVAGGGLTAVIDRTINGLALYHFAQDVGLAASKRAVDGEIASIPAFQGFDGKFSQTAYDQILQQQRLTDRQLREDISRDMLARQLIAPTAGARQVPAQLALPYASLLLERRRGVVGYIPVAALGAGTPPTDGELQTFYTRQRARYTVPERRTIRYAVVRAADVAATAKPTAAEIAAAYRSQAARFAASEKRTLTQVVVAQQAQANQIAARAKGGTALAAAARAIGLEANTATAVDKAAFTTQSSAAVANAAFAAAAGQVVGPVRSPLGWHVVRVDAVTPVAGKSLAEATPELTTELGKTKAQEALARINADLDSAIGGNATFDEVIADAKLQPQTTRPLLASGVDPDAPTPTPDPVLARIAPAAFAAEQGDAPQLVPVDPDGSFAVVAIGQVVPAAPRPLAQIRDAVVRDFVADRNLRAARQLATAAVNKANGGTPLAQALAQTGLRLPPVQPINASRADLARQGGQLPPPVALLFSMAAKRAKLIEAPNRAGWYVVYLDAIQGGNAAGNTALIASTRQGLGGVIGREFTEQFTAAVKRQVGVKRDEAAIARVASDLAGGAQSR
ncbi:peptidyl-prolyl cis-trans isomerase D [Sphingomonas guangdongensis]|uniref:Parvulin-like PPIase n=1 Tax=Sphingomonas guangdongensis TaxID=1141890 RepID=A0A285QZW0_9SPHN|nr:SurA N-terminal domain-containing protein [Sphingomonas guangdongensis]SOB87038.1 peptidyl-prolyl cis-trans isomerase D [Sphingomonas guangdongensis]